MNIAYMRILLEFFGFIVDTVLEFIHKRDCGCKYAIRFKFYSSAF